MSRATSRFVQQFHSPKQPDSPGPRRLQQCGKGGCQRVGDLTLARSDQGLERRPDRRATSALPSECAHIAPSNVRTARPNAGSFISSAPGPNASRTQSKCLFSMVCGGSDTVRNCLGSVSIGQRLGSMEPSAITENERSETTGSFNDAPDDNRNSASIHHRVLRRSKPVGRVPCCNAISISTSIHTPPRAGFHGPGWCWSARSGRRKASMYGDITWAYVLRRTNPSQISNSSTGSPAPASPPNSDTFSGCICIAVTEVRVGSKH